MKNTAEDRFGVPESVLRAVREIHRGVLRSGLFVPTRSEVATMPPDSLSPIILDWLWESPSMLIPTNDQIEEVLAIIESRPNADEFTKLISECRQYVEYK